jgi:prevent-host-death family protein
VALTTVNLLEAKANLSKLVEAVESGVETEITIARDGKPVARLVALAPGERARRKLGLLDGKFPRMSLEDFSADDEEIAAMFSTRASSPDS